MIDGIGRSSACGKCGISSAFVLDHEITVGLRWHDQCLGLDRPERNREIASIYLVVTGVRLLPGPELSQQVVGIPRQDVGFRHTYQKFLKAGGSLGSGKAHPGRRRG